MAKQLDSGKVLCEQCGNEYKQIGNHWTLGSTCDHPELDRVTKEALIGLLMSDGSIQNKHSKNQCMIIGMIKKDFLEWLDDKFNWLSTGVSLQITGEESAKNNRKSGFSPKAEEKDYSDVWLLQTRAHPFITELTEWYSSGSKIWPTNINITPTTLLMLYVGDGSYIQSEYHRYLQISLSNEIGNEDKIEHYFMKKDLPVPSYWDEYEGVKHISLDAHWYSDIAYKLFNYMTQSPWWDGPPPGFEYKFPENFGGTGKSMLDLEN